jgi:hypothetical protein
MTQNVLEYLRNIENPQHTKIESSSAFTFY